MSEGRSNSSTPPNCPSGSSPISRTPKRHRPTVYRTISGSYEDKTNDFLCPICLNLIEEAHITRCGHTFCYNCICKSLETLGRCPKCNLALSGEEHIIPNFLLNELVTKHRQKINYAESLGMRRDSSGELGDGFRDFVASESQNLSLPDVNVILEVLTQRKQLLEAESCAAQNRLLHEFLTHLLQSREEQSRQLAKEMAVIRRDIDEVEAILKDVHVKCPELENGESPTDEAGVLKKALDLGIDVDYQRPAFSFSSLATRRRRMHAHFDDFVNCYFACRSKDVLFGKEESGGAVGRSGRSDRPDRADRSGLEVFRENLVKFSRYNSLRPLATLNYSSDLFNNSTIVSSIEFDKDNEFFAIAGVTKRIKVFDYGAVVRDTVDIHYPILEMVSSSKISCISWNTYHKGILASSDYEGTVTVWDAATGQKTKTFQEHEKRCWSVDFNDVDTRLIASGSDDARVKLWSLNIEHSVATLEAKANVCCVKFNPRSSCHLAFGSADHCVHYYDLRNMKEPVAVFKGHRKAVSYVKFINMEEIVSASTDSQLKMWNINTPHYLRSFVGHVNEKNFVGLATDGDYVACGSENNSLYVYYKGLSKQLFSFKFDAVRSLLEQERKEEEPNEFVSAVCWRPLSNVLVAANSQGIIKILELA